MMTKRVIAESQLFQSKINPEIKDAAESHPHEFSNEKLVQRVHSLPQLLTSANILQLQRVIGNQAVMRLLTSRAAQGASANPNAVQRVLGGDFADMNLAGLKTAVRNHTVEKYEMKFIEHNALKSRASPPLTTIQEIVAALGKTYKDADAKQEQIMYADAVYNDNGTTTQVTTKEADDGKAAIYQQFTDTGGILYRGDDREPEKLLQEGFTPRNGARDYQAALKDLQVVLQETPGAKMESWVRNNEPKFQYVATGSAYGASGSKDYIYAINVPMTVVDPSTLNFNLDLSEANSNRPAPKIYMNVSEGLIAVSPAGTKEITFFSPVPAKFIKAYKPRAEKEYKPFPPPKTT